MEINKQSFKINSEKLEAENLIQLFLTQIRRNGQTTVRYNQTGNRRVWHFGHIFLQVWTTHTQKKLVKLDLDFLYDSNKEDQFIFRGDAGWFCYWQTVED